MVISDVSKCVPVTFWSARFVLCKLCPKNMYSTNLFATLCIDCSKNLASIPMLGIDKMSLYVQLLFYLKCYIYSTKFLSTLRSRRHSLTRRLVYPLFSPSDGLACLPSPYCFALSIQSRPVKNYLHLADDVFTYYVLTNIHIRHTCMWVLLSIYLYIMQYQGFSKLPSGLRPTFNKLQMLHYFYTTKWIFCYNDVVSSMGQVMRSLNSGSCGLGLFVRDPLAGFN